MKWQWQWQWKWNGMLTLLVAGRGPSGRLAKTWRRYGRHSGTPPL
jgi:hypothetical protein